MSKALNFKEQSIELCKKTGNISAPILMHQFQNGVEKGAYLFAPLCNKDKVAKMQQRLMKDFSDKELESADVGHSPEMILALMAILKQSVIDWMPITKQ